MILNSSLALAPQSIFFQKLQYNILIFKDSKI